MNQHPARALRASALGFAAATAFTSVVAARQDLPGRPLGVGIPLSVPAGLLAGWGAAVAAPWPMAVAALLAAARAGHPAGRGPALVCAGLGLGGVAGILMESHTYRPGSWAPATRVAVAVHLAASGALAAAGLVVAPRIGRGTVGSGLA